MKVSVTACARCGADHADLEFRALERHFAPPEASPIVWTHWAACPTNGDPILLSASPAEDPAP